MKEDSSDKRAYIATVVVVVKIYLLMSNMSDILIRFSMTATPAGI